MFPPEVDHSPFRRTNIAIFFYSTKDFVFFHTPYRFFPSQETSSDAYSEQIKAIQRHCRALSPLQGGRRRETSVGCDDGRFIFPKESPKGGNKTKRIGAEGVARVSPEIAREILDVHCSCYPLRSVRPAHHTRPP